MMRLSSCGGKGSGERGFARNQLHLLGRVAVAGGLAGWESTFEFGDRLRVENDLAGGDIVLEVRDVARARDRYDALGQDPGEADLCGRDVETLGDILDHAAATRIDRDR